MPIGDKRSEDVYKRQVRMVENCGMPDEHIYNGVEEIPDDAGYYSLIIAKEKAEEK